MRRSDGRVAIITGASKGIGRAVADQFVSDGFDLLLVARSAAELQVAQGELASSGRKVAFHAVDLRNPAAADAVRDEALAAFGRVDVLVNCAGATKGGPFLDLSDEVWQDGFALKFFGAMRLCRSIWPLLRESRGAVVNIVGGFARAPDPDFLIGGAVNAALANFTKGLSRQGIRDDVTVNAIHPGTTMTDRLLEIVATRARLEGVGEKEVLASMAEREKIRRLGEPEDVARLVGFLCGPGARHIQGVAISVDGGATPSLF